ncbi:hypothetical protein SUGI_0461570 [Cryptomeria japonica]|nr:hypothetical protein SUGI_0461570 [Cryptomeria japonica]
MSFQFLLKFFFEEISVATRHTEDLEFICDELESIKCLLNDAGGVWRTNSSSVRNWLQKLEDFLYDTLHLLEDSSQAPHHTNCISRYLLGRKIRVLKERILCIHRSSKYLMYLRDIDVKPRPGLVLENVGAHRIHHMDYFSEENSCRLFCIHAFPEDHNHSPPEELERVARAIERKCSRLPLAVKTVAASMASVN